MRIKMNAKTLQTATNFPAHRRGSLTDSSGEHQGIEAAQRRRQRSDGLAQLIAEQFHRLSGMWVTCPLVKQGLHVRANAGHAEQSCLVVHKPRELARIIVFLVNQVEQDAWIQVASAGVPIMRPPEGVKPIVVSMGCPSFIAAMLTPLPKWATMTRPAVASPSISTMYS